MLKLPGNFSPRVISETTPLKMSYHSMTFSFLCSNMRELCVTKYRTFRKEEEETITAQGPSLCACGHWVLHSEGPCCLQASESHSPEGGSQDLSLHGPFPPHDSVIAPKCISVLCSVLSACCACSSTGLHSGSSADECGMMSLVSCDHHHKAHKWAGLKQQKCTLTVLEATRSKSRHWQG